jgi:hypothetical protein
MEAVMFKKSFVSILIISALSACSSSDSDKNSAPTAINISNNIVAENMSGASVGLLKAIDADTNDTFTFSTDSELFTIDGNELKLQENIALDFEQNAQVEVAILVTDSANNTYNDVLTIDVEDVLDVYAFTNKLSNSDSVSYSGQVARHVLIAELNNYIASGLQADLDNQALTSRDEVRAKLMSYYKTTAEDYELDLGQRALTISTGLERKQNTLSDISSSKKDLYGKIAGIDAAGQHKDWTTEFVAFGAKGSVSPDQLIQSFFNKIADHAEAYLAGHTRSDINGNVINQVYLGTDGLDYKQLIQKTLLGAVTFSQGADDYLDNDTEGKGLLTDNVSLVDGKNYTNLEHQFDEGFGYFGAARDYLSYTDDELALKGGRANFQGMHDTDGDGQIDLKSEYNFGHSLNAAKRDRGTATSTSPTDFTTQAMEAFLNARAIIGDNVGSQLSDEQMAALVAQRDIALSNWELAIAATAVHYINDTIADYAVFETDDFSYADLAKHWSELKGFFISLQFNRLSPLSDADFEAINTLIGDAPELTAENVDSYVADLLEARAKLQAAYAFDADHVSNW